jgi:hypothetical protein
LEKEEEDFFGSIYQRCPEFREKEMPPLPPQIFMERILEMPVICRMRFLPHAFAQR